MTVPGGGLLDDSHFLGDALVVASVRVHRAGTLLTAATSEGAHTWELPVTEAPAVPSRLLGPPAFLCPAGSVTVHMQFVSRMVVSGR